MAPKAQIPLQYSGSGSCRTPFGHTYVPAKHQDGIGSAHDSRIKSTLLLTLTVGTPGRRQTSTRWGKTYRSDMTCPQPMLDGPHTVKPGEAGEERTTTIPVAKSVSPMEVSWSPEAPHSSATRADGAAERRPSDRHTGKAFPTPEGLRVRAPERRAGEVQ